MARQFKQIIEEAGEFSMQQREQTIRERMTLNLKEFAGKVAAFNKLGEALYGGGNFNKLAEDLEEIANGAEAYTLRETEDSPFDQVTIKRNMKELRGYTTEFKKVAAEARALQERMTALYEDSGRVLSRYFEIKEMGQPDGMGDQNDLAIKGEDEKIINARAGVREVQGGLNESAVGRTQQELIKLVNDRIFANKLHVKMGMELMLMVYNAHTEKALDKARNTINRVLGIKEGSVKENEGMCEGCGKPMEQCECKMNEAEKWIQKAVDPEHKGYCTPMTKSTCTPARKALAKRFKKGIENEVVKEGKLSLKKLMEDINDDYPREDWVKLDVPMLKYDVALEFEKDLKKKGFDVKRHDWKERAAQGEEFSEFFVKKDDFNEANKYAVDAYQSYDNNARMENE